MRVKVYSGIGNNTGVYHENFFSQKISEVIFGGPMLILTEFHSFFYGTYTTRCILVREQRAEWKRRSISSGKGKLHVRMLHIRMSAIRFLLLITSHLHRFEL